MLHFPPGPDWNLPRMSMYVVPWPTDLFSCHFMWIYLFLKPYETTTVTVLSSKNVYVKKHPFALRPTCDSRSGEEDPVASGARNSSKGGAETSWPLEDLKP